MNTRGTRILGRSGLSRPSHLAGVLVSGWLMCSQASAGLLLNTGDRYSIEFTSFDTYEYILPSGLGGPLTGLFVTITFDEDFTPRTPFGDTNQFDYISVTTYADITSDPPLEEVSFFPSESQILVLGRWKTDWNDMTGALQIGMDWGSATLESVVLSIVVENGPGFDVYSKVVQVPEPGRWRSVIGLLFVIGACRRGRGPRSGRRVGRGFGRLTSALNR